MYSDSSSATDCSSQPGLILVGNPNVGKSAIFGALTGKYVVVSNYPGTTVEVSQGTATLNRRKTTITDTPGANSLVPMSEDERVTRDILIDTSPTAVVQVADAKNLQRGLVISSQLAELELPFILVLNMADEAKSRGIRTDTAALSKIIGVPVISTIATQKQGIDRLIQNLDHAAVSKYKVRFDETIEGALDQICSQLGDGIRGRRGIALAILSEDESLTEWLHNRLSEETINAVESIRAKTQERYPEPLGYVINIQRLKALEKLIRDVVRSDDGAKRSVKGVANLKRIHPLLSLPLFAAAVYGLVVLTSINPLFAALGFPLLWIALYIFGDYGMHPVYGLPILAGVLFLTWLFVGNFGAGTCVDLLQNGLFAKYVDPAAIKVVKAILPWKFAQDLIVGPYGLITMAMTYAFAIVLPIVATFFMTFGVLEDSGYLPRLAVMVDRVFKKMGLNGKAVLPMILGLGCDTMATLTARILDTKRERVIVTLLLALGVPCSAQLGVTLGMLSSPGVPIAAPLIWAGVVLLVLFQVGYLAGKIMPGQKTDFILEVPPVRLPQLGNIALKTLARVEWYVKEAVPLFAVGALVLFTADRLGLIKVAERVASPVIQGFLGLPAKATEAFIVGFLRRDYGVAGLYQMARHHQLDMVQVLVGLVTMTLFIPCLANFLVIIKERGIKTAIAMALFIIPYALLVGGALNWVLRATGAFR